MAGIKLGWAARWRKPGLRYPLAALASGCFHGYWSGAVGGAASSLVAAALGGACGHSGEGYVGLHTALLVIVAFFSVAMAARLHVRPATEALAAAQRKLTPVLPGVPQDLPPTPGDGIIPTPAPSSDDGGEVRSGNEWAAHCLGCVAEMLLVGRGIWGRWAGCSAAASRCSTSDGCAPRRVCLQPLVPLMAPPADRRCLLLA